MLFEMRKKDRVEEKSAVTKAISVLSQEAPSLLQLGTRTRRAAIRLHAGCRNCGRAAKLLKASATRLHSELLATAAMTTGSGEALIPVIGQLTDLVRRIEEQQKAEEEHKEWCENELAETNAQKSHHEQLVEELKNHIEETEAVIAEKKQSIADTLEAIKTADEEMKEMEAVRGEEAEHRGHARGHQDRRRGDEGDGGRSREGEAGLRGRARGLRGLDQRAEPGHRHPRGLLPRGRRGLHAGAAGDAAAVLFHPVQAAGGAGGGGARGRAGDGHADGWLREEGRRPRRQHP